MADSPVVIAIHPEPTTGKALRKKPPKRQTTGVVSGGLDKQPLPAIGYVRLRATNHAQLGLVAELDGDVTPSGYGQHNITARPGRVGITGYSGRDPLGLRIPILFDRWTDQASIEADVRMLERLHGLDSDLDQPPTIIVEGLGIPHSYSRAPQNRFVLTGDPEWGDDVRYRATDGHRLYQSCVISALLLVRPESLADATTAKTDGARHYYTVPKAGHPSTLRGIAKKYGKDWQTVRKLNPQLAGDPDRALPAGTKVRYS